MYNRKQAFEKSGNNSFFLWGARQTGKSTLLKKLYPESLWFDLLQTDIFERLQRHPRWAKFTTSTFYSWNAKFLYEQSDRARRQLRLFFLLQLPNWPLDQLTNWPINQLTNWPTLPLGEVCNFDLLFLKCEVSLIAKRHNFRCAKKLCRRAGWYLSFI